jgi:acetyl esterase/lipase
VRIHLITILCGLANNRFHRTGHLVTPPTHVSIAKGKGVNGAYVEAVPDLVRGDLAKFASDAKISSVRVTGYWFLKKGSNVTVDTLPGEGEKILYHMHGGGFVRFSAHPSDPTSLIPKMMVKNIRSIKRCFSVEYRLSISGPEVPANPFPAAIIDALAGYNYLVNKMGFSSSNIIMCGDSAGGNIVLALTRYLVENVDAPDIPAPPGGIILLSPWADLGMSHQVKGQSAYTNMPSDYIGNDYDGAVEYSKASYFGPHGKDFAETNRYVSPASRDPGLHIDFKGFPRTFINGGSAEVLVDIIRTLRDKMVRDLGEGDGIEKGEGKVRYWEEPDAVHDYLTLPYHEPERTLTVKAIGDWIEKAL